MGPIVSGARRYVVIGASGILAPLGGLLARPGVTTTGIARASRPGSGTWDDWVSLDATRPGEIRRWLAGSGPVAVLVAYSPAVGVDVWPLLSAGSGYLAVVATTEWADPAAPVAPWSGLADLVVQLGWADDADGSRWHTPQEISVAVSGVLFPRTSRTGVEPGAVPAHTRPATVGSTRPWSRRPG